MSAADGAEVTLLADLKLLQVETPYWCRFPFVTQILIRQPPVRSISQNTAGRGSEGACV